MHRFPETGDIAHHPRLNDEEPELVRRQKEEGRVWPRAFIEVFMVRNW